MGDEGMVHSGSPTSPNELINNTPTCWGFCGRTRTLIAQIYFFIFIYASSATDMDPSIFLVFFFFLVESARVEAKKKKKQPFAHLFLSFWHSLTILERPGSDEPISIRRSSSPIWDKNFRCVLPDLSCTHFPWWRWWWTDGSLLERFKNNLIS